eukprot:392919_1
MDEAKRTIKNISVINYNHHNRLSISTQQFYYMTRKQWRRTVHGKDVFGLNCGKRYRPQLSNLTLSSIRIRSQPSDSFGYQANEETELTDTEPEYCATVPHHRSDHRRVSTSICTPQFDRKSRALLLEQKWLREIINGSKTWELRSCNTRIKGKVFLAHKDMIYGETYIIDSFQIDKRELVLPENIHKHHVLHPLRNDKIIAWTKVYVWVLANTKEYQDPIQFTRKQGQQVWCKIIDDIDQ